MDDSIDDNPGAVNFFLAADTARGGGAAAAPREALAALISLLQGLVETLGPAGA